MIRPLADNVLVRPVDADSKTDGGIILPDTAHEKPEKGVVVAVGQGKRGSDGQLVPMEVQEGDYVVFSRYGGDEVKGLHEKLLIMAERNVLAVIETGEDNGD